jgi:hypothetical protein
MKSNASKTHSTYPNLHSTPKTTEDVLAYTIAIKHIAEKACLCRCGWDPRAIGGRPHPHPGNSETAGFTPPGRGTVRRLRSATSCGRVRRCAERSPVARADRALGAEASRGDSLRMPLRSRYSAIDRIRLGSYLPAQQYLCSVPRKLSKQHPESRPQYLPGLRALL